MTGAFGYLFNQTMKRLAKYNNVSFDEDRKIRQKELELKGALTAFGNRLESQCSECIERFKNWTVSVDMDRSQSSFDAVTAYSTQSTTFFKQWFIDGISERLDGVAHEFRHLMPENNQLRLSSDLVRGSQAQIEQDATSWAKNFWKTQQK